MAVKTSQSRVTEGKSGQMEPPSRKVTTENIGRPMGRPTSESGDTRGYAPGGMGHSKRS